MALHDKIFTRGATKVEIYTHSTFSSLLGNLETSHKRREFRRKQNIITWPSTNFCQIVEAPEPEIYRLQMAFVVNQYIIISVYEPSLEKDEMEKSDEDFLPRSLFSFSFFAPDRR